jgi:hypothetical protein
MQRFSAFSFRDYGDYAGREMFTISCQRAWPHAFMACFCRWLDHSSIASQLGLDVHAEQGSNPLLRARITGKNGAFELT